MKSNRVLGIFIGFLFMGWVFQQFKMASIQSQVDILISEVAVLHENVDCLEIENQQQASKLSFHDSNFRNVDFFGGWAVSSIEQILSDSLPTWGQFLEMQRAGQKKE